MDKSTQEIFRASKTGDKIAEGKTKVIYQVPEKSHLVRLVSKCNISAGNGVKVNGDVAFNGNNLTFTERYFGWER